MPPSYIWVRAVVWAYGHGQTHRQTHRRAWPQYILRRLRLTQNVTTTTSQLRTVGRTGCDSDVLVTFELRMLQTEAWAVQSRWAVQLTTDEVQSNVFRDDVQHRNDRPSTFLLLDEDLNLSTPPSTVITFQTYTQPVSLAEFHLQ